MSCVQTRADLVSALIQCIDAYNLDNSSAVKIAYENKGFDSTGSSMYVACSLIPATSTPLGKTSLDGDDRRGIFQVSVYVASNAADYDIGQFSLTDYIVSWFRYNSIHGIATITGQTVNNGRKQESWFIRDISINYLSFVDRG